jgi:rSAM/selenodomain-associated transferase 2
MAAQLVAAVVAVEHSLKNGAKPVFGYKISIIIPALNEASNIEETLAPLQPLRSAGHEVILSDGGSSDRTTAIAKPLVDKIISSQPGRAVQMNRGAEQAAGDILWFLHADTIPPPNAGSIIIDCLASRSKVWGRFDVSLSGRSPIFRLIEFMMNQRSCITGIATGDQGIFMLRYAFDQVDGFTDIPLMEDIAMSTRLKGIKPPACIEQKLIVSSRKWEENGIIKTVLLMWWLRLAYFFGASPGYLAKQYYSSK